MAMPGCQKRGIFNYLTCTQFQLRTIFLVSTFLTLILTLFFYQEEIMKYALRHAFRTNLSSTLLFRSDISTPEEVVSADVEAGKNNGSRATFPFNHHDIIPTRTRSASGKIEAGKDVPFSQEETLREYEKKFHMENVDCAKIFQGVDSEVEKGRNLAAEMRDDAISLSDEFYISETANCDSFITERGYLNSYLTNDEREFPIAFSILIFKDIEMFERLLRAVYRPQNFYCIHVDAKSKETYFKAITKISTCFPNVFLASRRVNVFWGQFSVLQPELICMEDLWARSKKWKYFINLTGQEFPLKTNAELIAILKAYDGANDVSGVLKSANFFRWSNAAPPEGIRPFKGSVHIVVNRKFVDYLLHNETAHKLLLWVKRTAIPDETFFATLNHNPHLGIPGTYTGELVMDVLSKPCWTRYKVWANPSQGWRNCASKRSVRSICILSTDDLQLLGDTPHLFANKFHLQNDRIAIGCLEEKHFNDTRDEYFGVKSINTTFYKNLAIVKNKIPVWTKDDEN